MGKKENEKNEIRSVMIVYPKGGVLYILNSVTEIQYYVYMHTCIQRHTELNGTDSSRCIVHMFKAKESAVSSSLDAFRDNTIPCPL